MIFSDPFLFALALIDTGAILFLQIYFIIILTDLESDYLNAQECCSKLNFWITPKLMAHTVLLTLLLFHGHWLLALVNLPLTGWLIRELFHIPQGNLGVFDPAEIHNGGKLRKHLRDCMVYLGYYLLFFFIYLYCMIVSLLEGDPINRHEEDMIVH